ncbi:hypothetical protein HQ520_18770 [bacterium]|nr:hypothetical protein [bacterium]
MKHFRYPLWPILLAGIWISCAAILFAQPPGQSQTADILFPNPVPISIIMTEFRDQTGVDVQLRGKTSALKIPFQGSNLAAEDFLNSISDQQKLIWRQTPQGYELWDQETYNAEVLPTLVEQKVFIPVHISAKYLHDAIKQSEVITPNVGHLALDERTNKVIVTDLPEKLAIIQDMVNLLDEPQYTRVFYIRYKDVESVFSKIESFKSEAGTIETDPQAHLIIVRDVLANIQRMEAMIELLDVRQPRRVYNLNTIGFEGEGAEQLESNLQEIITPDAFYVIDESRGLLVLEDTEDVHEEVEKFLQVFDRPIDQVRIEAELLDVDQTSGLSYGTELSFSEDLPSAVADGLISNFAAGSIPGNPFGFVNYQSEFPLIGTGAGGFGVRYLNSKIKAQLSAALTDSNTRILLRPRVTVKNRENVSLFTGRETPIPVVQPLSYNSGSSSDNFTVTQQTIPSGLTVELEPTISPTGLIEMNVSIENSTANTVDLATNLQNLPTIKGVEKFTDNIETVLIIPDGQTRVISGLLNHTRDDSVTGVPFLVRIPILGPLFFGSKIKSDRIRNLLFFITPTIVREVPSGSILAFDFDDMQAGDNWSGTQTRMVLPTETPYEEPIYEQEEPTSPTARFYAPTPEDLWPSVEDDMTSPGSPFLDLPPEGLNLAPNTPEGLEKALMQGGGRLPTFDQRKAGWSGEFRPEKQPEKATGPAPRPTPRASAARRPTPTRPAPPPTVRLPGQAAPTAETQY